MTRPCAFCDAPFEPKVSSTGRCPGGQTAQRFCSTACKRAWTNLWSKRGQLLGPLGAAWRGLRGATTAADKRLATQALNAFCKLLDEANAEDRAAGRQSAVEYVHRKLRYSGGAPRLTE